MKNMKSLIINDNTKVMPVETQHTFENMYVGDLDSMIENRQSCNYFEAKFISTNDSQKDTDPIAELIKSNNTKTLIHVINMSKFHKILVKSDVMKRIYELTNFSVIWDHIGDEIINNLDDEIDDVKVVYLPKLLIPESTVETYSKKSGNVEFNLFIIVLPNLYIDENENSRNEIVNTIQKVTSYASDKDCHDLIIDISDISKNNEIIDDVLKLITMNLLKK